MSRTLSNGGTDAPKTYRDTALTNTVVGISTQSSDLIGWNIINLDSSTVYVKFYDIASSGSVTLGTTEPVKVLLVPSNSTVYMEYNKFQSQYYFKNGICAVSVTGIADSSTTAPTTATYVEIYYKTT